MDSEKHAAKPEQLDRSQSLPLAIRQARLDPNDPWVDFEGATLEQAAVSLVRDTCRSVSISEVDDVQVEVRDAQFPDTIYTVYVTAIQEFRTKLRGGV